MGTNYIEGRKLEESKMEGEYEINKIHVIKISDIKMFENIVTICEQYDDVEDAYFKGINFSWEDLYSIDVDKFLDTVEEYIKEQIKDYDYTDEEQLIIDAKNVLDFLEKYEGYSFIFKEDQEE